MANLSLDNRTPNLVSVTATAPSYETFQSASFGLAARSALNQDFRVESPLATKSFGSDIRDLAYKIGNFLFLDFKTTTCISTRKDTTAAVSARGTGAVLSVFSSRDVLSQAA